MYRRSIVIVSIVCALAVPLALNRTTRSESSAAIKPSSDQGSNASKERFSNIPTHRPYLFLFEHINRLKTQAENVRRQGKDGSGFQRRFKNVLKVDDRQFQSLEEIAQHCQSETALLDQQAKVITDEFRKKYPPGVVPEGVVIPPPPPELSALQEMRTNAVLRARERVKAILGEQAFASFDENLKRQLLPNMQLIHPQAK